MQRPEPAHASTRAAAVRVIAITGGKGGTGKTSIAVNLATALVQQGRRVLLLDGDLGLANVDVMLGLAPRCTLEQVIGGERSLEEIIVTAPSGLQVVPASSGVARMANLCTAEHASIVHQFQALSSPPEFLLIDTATGVADSVLSFSQGAQEVIVVLCNEPSSLTDSYALIKLLNRHYRLRRFRILCNQVRHQDEGASLFKRLRGVTDRYLEVQLEFCGVVPSDEHVLRAVRAQRTYLEAYPQCPAAKAIRRLAEQLQGWPLPTGPSGRIEFFMERMLEPAPSAAVLRVVE